MGSKEWFTLFPNTGIKHYPIQISDHAPIEVDLNLTRSEGKKPFKIDAWVLEYEEYLERIRRAGRNHIHGIKCDDGQWNYDDRQVSGEFQKTFMDLDMSSREDMEMRDRSVFEHILKQLKHQVTHDEADRLNRPFTAKEVHGTVFQMGALKAPRPYGIPAIFYQKCWSMIKGEFIKAVLSILNSGRVLREVNRTFITLIPKTENPKEVSDYRPISLCNVMMRVVTKCIANRLDKVMGSLVSEMQNAFLPGRSISDNILLAHGAIHNISNHKKGRQGRCAFKADMSKAYDRIRRDFLESVLAKLGFPQKLIMLIMSCVTSVSYEILFNGAPLPQFRPWCGLRQGDPLSSYLFILCMEDKGETETHLMSLINDYYEASGQKLNWEKSGIIFSPNTTLAKVQQIMKVVNIKKNRGFFDKKLFGRNVFRHGMSPIKGSGSSWGVRNILHVLEMVMENIGWKREIESNLNVWISRWVRGRCPEPKDCWLDLGNVQMANLQVRHLIQPDCRWNEPFVRALFTEEYAARILAIPLCALRINDEIYWPLTKDGAYTVKSGYGLIFGEYMARKGSSKDKTRIGDRGREFCRKQLWKLPVPKLWKIFVWKIITNTLPIGKEFQKRNLEIDVFCGMCGVEQKRVETAEHLFRDCGVSSRIWVGSDLGIRVENAESISITDWVMIGFAICPIGRKGSGE
ncbi:uncharacterized protein LOC141632895 [Silene latifolia]|uniref:uncharacterized protein LOC141632895 n=1 Tax=Silene latifolia TaxID=37657 RepID=UPI003D77F94E